MKTGTWSGAGGPAPCSGSEGEQRPRLAKVVCYLRGVRFLSLALLIWLAAGVRLRAGTNDPPATVSAPAKPAVAQSPEQIQKEYQKLLADDDAAQAEVDQWIQENRKFAEKGAGVPEAELRQRIEVRLAPVRKAYEDFLQRHPNHVRALLAYGSLLNDLQDDIGTAMQWEKARELDPKRKVAKVNAALCQGCGACVANCPNKACQLRNTSSSQVMAMIEALTA